MKLNRKRVRVLIKGGVLSPSEMKNVLKAAKLTGNTSIHFGSRQDIVFHINEEGIADLEKTFSKTKIDFVYEDQDEVKHQNIVSSYVASGILPSTSWVTSGSYLYLLEGFNDLKSLKVNIVDPKQNLVPLFYGHLNFIASDEENYWFLKVKLPGEKNIKTWPVLVFTEDVHELAASIESLVESGLTDVSSLFDKVEEEHSFNSKDFQEKLVLPSGFFPYYEGVNRMLNGNNQWIGFYWRNNRYDVQFLAELCDLCIKTGIAKLCITPWKSFLVKEIQPNDKLLWEQLIGRFGINMRHSAFELNWHLPVLDDKSLKLKNYIIKRFDKVDVRTFGLTFSIGTRVEESFTSVVIREEGLNKFLGALPFLKTYEVLVANKFNLNSTKYTAFASGLSKDRIPETLIELCRKYYNDLDKVELKVELEKPERLSLTKEAFQCASCLTVYDEKNGDFSQGIKAGTNFNDLPEEYCCSLCESSKSNFKSIQLGLEWVS